MYKLLEVNFYQDWDLKWIQVHLESLRRFFLNLTAQGEHLPDISV